MHVPAPSTEIAAPQDAKLSALAPEPSEPLTIMKPTFETRRWGPGTISSLLLLDRKQLCYLCLLTGQFEVLAPFSLRKKGRASNR